MHGLTHTAPQARSVRMPPSLNRGLDSLAARKTTLVTGNNEDLQAIQRTVGDSKTGATAKSNYSVTCAACPENGLRSWAGEQGCLKRES